VTAREHLKSFHEKAAEFHKGMAKHFAKRAEALDDDDAKKFHESVAEAHTEHGAYHKECCKDLDKAITDELRKVVPSRASGIPSSDVPEEDCNPHSALGKRLIVKPGQREDRQAIDPVLAATVAADD
jgi:hypothetical protein